MKITVVPRIFISKAMNKNPEWYMDKWIISIFSSPYCCRESAFSPVPAAVNVCHLQFDDVTEKDTEAGLIHFSPELAQKIKTFISNIKDDGSREMYIHCDAGVSRSGAVGIVLNEYFNKFLTDNAEDVEFFLKNNPHVMGNPEVTRILKDTLFEVDYKMLFTDHDFDSDGEMLLKDVLI